MTRLELRILIFALQFQLMGVISILVIAVGLAMDSFAVSIAGGISLKPFRVYDALRTGLFMGVAQALFFVVGYFIASSVDQFIQVWDHWIAFVLLGGVGLKMIFERHKNDEDQFVDLRRKRILATLAVATSIDALAVGISFSFLHYDITSMALTIGITSFIFSAGGVYLGAFFSRVQAFPTYLIGGLLLIGIGVKIVVEHLVYNI